MKKILIMIGIVSMFSSLFAKNITLNEMDTVHLPKQMKYLYQRYTMLKNKKSAWLKRKKVLIREFKELYQGVAYFGEDNHYGKKRLERRQKAFYTSLKAQDDEIEEKLSIMTRKLHRADREHASLVGSIQ